MFITTILFTYHILTNNVILGTGDTAPFSKWSYSKFICEINPFLLIILLFFCTYTFSKKEFRVRTITMTTPMSTAKYYLIKGASIFFAYAITAAVTIGLSLIFYALVFKFYSFQDFIVPILLFLLPPAIFIFGLAMVLGSINEFLIFILMPVVYFIGNVNYKIPLELDLFCNNFIENYLFSIKINLLGDVPFLIPGSMIISRLTFIAIGILLFAYLCIISNKK